VEGATKLSDRNSSAFGHVLEDMTEFDSRKVADAVAQAKKRRKLEAAEAKAKGKFGLEDERNRKYNSIAGDSSGALSPEEYEAYRLTRDRADDPMAKFT